MNTGILFKGKILRGEIILDSGVRLDNVTTFSANVEVDNLLGEVVVVVVVDAADRLRVGSPSGASPPRACRF